MQSSLLGTRGFSWRTALPALLLLLSASLRGQQGFTTTGATFGTVVSLNSTPSDILLDEVRGRMYLVNAAANRVDIYDIAGKKLTGFIRTGAFPIAGAMSLDNQYLYVTNVQSASLSVIDLGTGSTVQTVSLPSKPEGVAVGLDGRVLITTQGTGANNQTNQLLLFDKSQTNQQQVVNVQFPPPITTPNPLPAVFVGRPATAFPGRLVRTPDGRFIVGMVAINQTTNAAQTTLFTYETASGVVLQNRTVTGQSTVLSMSPDGGTVMAGSTLYDVSTLAVAAQLSASNAPFFFGTNTFQNPGFNLTQNYGGSAYSPDGTTIYGAFNTAGNGQRATATALFITDSSNLSMRLGIRLPESILGKMVMDKAGNNMWAASESGLLYLPISTIYDYPILQPETNTVFLANDDCNKGIARGAVRVLNVGKGKLTFAIPNQTAALITEITSGLAPATINFVMDPGRSGVVRQAGTNVWTGAGNSQGGALNYTLSSNEAINFPNAVRVFMNYRQTDQKGVVVPAPTSLAAAEGLNDLVLDESRGKIYISNSGFNRIEVFDIKKQKFLDPISAGQLPHSMAMTPDTGTLYVGNTGGESITTIDLDSQKITGQVQFPPIPRAGNQAALRPTAMAYGLSGLQFMMSNGGFWRVVGNTATPRVSNSVTPTTVASPLSMTSTPGGEFIFLLSSNANASGYLYDAIADTYTASRQLYNQAAVSYFGPVAGSKSGNFFLANGLILSPALAVVGGTERPGVTMFTPPAGPGQPPGQTIVSAGQRNIAAVFPIDENTFIRMTTPVRQNITSATRDDIRPVIEYVDIRNGSETVAAVAPENPLNNVFGTQRINVSARQMVADSQGTVYMLTTSGLTVLPLNLSGASLKPTITAGSRGILNSSDGTPNFRPGSFITINGNNLGVPAAADSITPPTVLGGSCVVFNETPLPLLQTSNGQISAQIPEDVRPGTNVVQVRSIYRAEQSDPILVTVQK